MYRDDREWLIARVAELESELEAAHRELARLRDELPENALAVRGRLVEQAREEEREHARQQAQALKAKLEEQLASRGGPRTPLTPSQQRQNIKLAIGLLCALAAVILCSAALAIVLR